MGINNAKRAYVFHDVFIFNYSYNFFRLEGATISFKELHGFNQAETLLFLTSPTCT